jgi:hypothetical protein
MSDLDRLQLLVWALIAILVFAAVRELANYGEPQSPPTVEELTTGARTPGT